MKLKDIYSLDKAINLNEGITNESFLIDKKYVYRHKKEILDPFNIPKNEFKVIKALKNEKYVEDVIDYNRKSGQKLSLFIEGTTRLDRNPSKKKLHQVHDVIMSLHALPTISGMDFLPFERIEFYKQKIVSEINPSLEKQIITEAKKLYQLYPLVLSHNDLVKGNLLFKEDRMFLLDFEYAGNNIELFDIASFLSENNIKSEEKKDYFISLFENINKKDVISMINFENILWYYWAKYLYKVTSRKIFQQIAEEKLISINNI